MKSQLACVAMILIWTAHVGAAGEKEPAAGRASAIVERYLAMPHAAEGFGQARTSRLRVLEELQSCPDAVQAVDAALRRVTNSLQRRELAGALSRFPTEQSAAVLCRLLNDLDDGLRGQAIAQLRMLARRVDRVGPKRTQRGNEFAPKVDGLVPYLIKAARDAAEQNRMTAMYALADTLDPAAVAELRRALGDESSAVRLLAACFLTEYNDASELPELKRALEQFKKREKDDLSYYRDAEMLLASMERLTGKNFGPVPMDPGLLSNLDQVPVTEAQFKRLLQAWSDWWAWQPKDVKD